MLSFGYEFIKNLRAKDWNIDKETDRNALHAAKKVIFVTRTMKCLKAFVKMPLRAEWSIITAYWQQLCMQCQGCMC